MEKLLLDVHEAASVLGCRRTFLYGMIQRGELPVVKLGRLTRIPAAALDQYVLEQWGDARDRPAASLPRHRGR
ncbi:MAG: helix-turn-helix domain-containing protein [Candidatus Dormiibacterota bacterium]